MANLVALSRKLWQNGLLTMKLDVKNGRLRVVAAVALDTHSGQRKLAGIMRYFNETLVPAGRPWDFEVQPNSFFVTTGWARRARRGGVDGIILSDYPSDETMRLVARSGIPCVVETAELKAACRMSTPSSSNVVRIICDARELAREAAQNLVVRQSFVSFGYVGTAENEPWSRERGAFFKEALAERGRECAVFNKSKRAGLGSWLASLPRPAAIFAANDSTAREVANAALGKGLRIPDDIAVLGIDDDPKFCLSASPAISSVVQDFESCGFQAAEALQRLMDGDTTEPSLLHYGARGVSIRKSTLSDSPHAALVQKALEVIDADADDPRFGVDEVARRLGVSRSLLDLRFREIERKSAHAVIRERRLEYASRLLAETKRSIEKITADCGFTNRTHLKKLFKTAFGCSMREWRRRSQKSG